MRRVAPVWSGVAITPNGAYAYVASFFSSTIFVIDTATNAVVDSIVGTTTNTVVATIPVGNFPQGIAIVVTSRGPTNKDQCKKDGWKQFTNPSFKNQGQCVSYVNHL